MATSKEHHRMETPTEMHWDESGPSLLALLAASTGLAVLILAALWFVFLRV